jgi:MoxR-like ATPase
MAMLRDREYVLPDDIKELATPVLAHRLILTEDERLRGSSPGQHLASIIRDLPVPVVP